MKKWKISSTKKGLILVLISLKNSSNVFSSPNPVDKKKYFDIMMDEFKFRKLFNSTEKLKQYEEEMEDD